MKDQLAARPRCVYHRVPEHLRGTTLYPLNQLRRIFPDLAVGYTQKYVGREALCERRIPRLDCRWNDVLMLSPVHPVKLQAALSEAGFSRFPTRWFAVDVALLSPSATVVYVPPKQPPADFAIREDDVVAFDPALLDAYGEVSERQRRHYEQAKTAGTARPLLFSGTPHVLFNGTLSLDQLHIIEG